MFPPDLKLAKVTRVYKNKLKTPKDNYRPVSSLSWMHMGLAKNLEISK